MNRTIALMSIKMRRIYSKDKMIKDKTVLNRFLLGFFLDNLLVGEAPVFSIPKENTKYTYEYVNVDEGDEIISCVIHYFKHGVKSPIRNVNNLKTTKTKEKNEADDLKQHIAIKLFDDEDFALLAYERIEGGVPIQAMRTAMRRQIEQYINNGEHLSIDIDPIISSGFLEELGKLKAIKALHIDVLASECTIDSDIMFSEKNIVRDEIEMIYRPEKSSSFSKTSIVNFFKKYMEAKKSSKRKVKSIRVQGSDGNAMLTVNTERIVMKKRIPVALSIDSHVDSQDILGKMKNILNDEDVKGTAQITLVEEDEEENDA